MDKTTKAINHLAKITMANRPIVLRAMNDLEFRQTFIQERRDRIAKNLRDARNRLKN